eukprot:4664079-Prymnesium_polylepis.1
MRDAQLGADNLLDARAQRRLVAPCHGTNAVCKLVLLLADQNEGGVIRVERRHIQGARPEVAEVGLDARVPFQLADAKRLPLCGGEHGRELELSRQRLVFQLLEVRRPLRADELPPQAKAPLLRQLVFAHDVVDLLPALRARVEELTTENLGPRHHAH